MRRKLLAKGYAAAIVDPLIERLTAERLLDDRRYVENFVGYHAARGQGPLRVRAQLRKIGASADLVGQCLAAFPGWIDALQSARRKKFGAQLPGAYADRVRQARFLCYRGFTSAQVRSALGLSGTVDLGDLGMDDKPDGEDDREP